MDVTEATKIITTELQDRQNRIDFLEARLRTKSDRNAELEREVHNNLRRIAELIKERDQVAFDHRDDDFGPSPTSGMKALERVKQIIDSWLGRLHPADHKIFGLQYVKGIINNVLKQIKIAQPRDPAFLLNGPVGKPNADRMIGLPRGVYHIRIVRTDSDPQNEYGVAIDKKGDLG